MDTIDDGSQDSAMKLEDLKLVSTLGQSLWAQPEQSAAITRETVSAVSFVATSPERAAERAAQALLDRANLKGMYTRVPKGLNSLFPEERFILLALHAGRWSYERIARVIREPVEQVQSLAWNARVYLALSHYPAAPKPTSATCPEYDPQRPWTQRFVDEELSGRERIFLQTHLSRCTSCRDALVRTKEVFYRVQTTIESLETHSPHPGLTAQLHSLVEAGEKARFPSRRGTGENLDRFFKRLDVRIAIAVWFFAMLWFGAHH